MLLIVEFEYLFIYPQLTENTESITIIYLAIYRCTRSPTEGHLFFRDSWWDWRLLHRADVGTSGLLTLISAVLSKKILDIWDNSEMTVNHLQMCLNEV